MFGIVLAMLNRSACSAGAERGDQQRRAHEPAQPRDHRAGGHHRAGGEDRRRSRGLAVRCRDRLGHVPRASPSGPGGRGGRRSRRTAAPRRCRGSARSPGSPGPSGSAARRTSRAGCRRRRSPAAATLCTPSRSVARLEQHRVLAVRPASSIVSRRVDRRAARRSTRAIFTVTGWSSRLVTVAANRPLLLDRVTARGASTSTERELVGDPRRATRSASRARGVGVGAAGVGQRRSAPRRRPRRPTVSLRVSTFWRVAPAPTSVRRRGEVRRVELGAVLRRRGSRASSAAHRGARREVASPTSVRSQPVDVEAAEEAGGRSRAPVRGQHDDQRRPVRVEQPDRGLAEDPLAQGDGGERVAGPGPPCAAPTRSRSTAVGRRRRATGGAPSANIRSVTRIVGAGADLPDRRRVEVAARRGDGGRGREAPGLEVACRCAGVRGRSSSRVVLGRGRRRRGRRTAGPGSRRRRWRPAACRARRCRGSVAAFVGVGSSASGSARRRPRRLVGSAARARRLGASPPRRARRAGPVSVERPRRVAGDQARVRRRGRPGRPARSPAVARRRRRSRPGAQRAAADRVCGPRGDVGDPAVGRVRDVVAERDHQRGVDRSSASSAGTSGMKRAGPAVGDVVAGVAGVAEGVHAEPVDARLA